MAIRDPLVDLLTELGDQYQARVIAYEDQLDPRDRRTIQLKQRTIERLPEAPTAAYKVTFIVTLASANVDPNRGEADLDEWAPQLLADLTQPWLSWTSAEKVLANENMAYDVDLYLIATTPTPAPVAQED
jgi:hypothetical protein